MQKLTKFFSSKKISHYLFFSFFSVSTFFHFMHNEVVDFSSHLFFSQINTNTLTHRQINTDTPTQTNQQRDKSVLVDRRERILRRLKGQTQVEEI